MDDAWAAFHGFVDWALPTQKAAVSGLGFRVSGLGFRVSALGFGVSGLGFRV